MGVMGPIRNGSIAPSPSVAVSFEEQVVVLTIQGGLDHDTGRMIIAAAAAVSDEEVHRLDIDLRGVTHFTEEGIMALAQCRVTSRPLKEGLHFRTSQGPGREALIAAFASTE